MRAKSIRARECREIVAHDSDGRGNYRNVRHSTTALKRFPAKWVPVQRSEFSKSMPPGLTRWWAPVLRSNTLSRIIEERVFFTRTGFYPRVKHEGMLRLKTPLKKTRQNKKPASLD